MSGMEEDSRELLQKVSKSMLLGLLWLFVNMTVGIYGGWFFFYDTPTRGNIIFYIWFVASLAFLIRMYWRIWFKKS